MPRVARRARPQQQRLAVADKSIKKPGRKKPPLNSKKRMAARPAGKKRGRGRTQPKPQINAVVTDDESEGEGIPVELDRERRDRKYIFQIFSPRASALILMIRIVFIRNGQVFFLAQYAVAP